MKRGHWIGAAVGAGVMFIGWLLSGHPIFQRGWYAMSCYVFSLAGALLGLAVAQIFYAEYRDAQVEDAPPQNDFAFKCIDDHTKQINALGDRLNHLEKRVSGISVVAGLRPKSVQETRS